jgi:hypothetical protein
VLGGLVKRIADGMTVLALGNPQDFAALEECASPPCFPLTRAKLGYE